MLWRELGIGQITSAITNYLKLDLFIPPLHAILPANQNASLSVVSVLAFKESAFAYVNSGYAQH